MLLYVTHNGASHLPAINHNQTEPVISTVYHGEIGSLGGDLFHTLATLFSPTNGAQFLPRFYPPFIEMCTTVTLMGRRLSRIKNDINHSVYNNIDKGVNSFTSTNRPLNGARSFCCSLGRR